MADDLLSPIKVSYSKQTEVTIVQPEDVTRAKASAWLDIISPITQWAGLKGDELHHKRELLRLEREAALEEVAKKLHSKLDDQVVTPLPTKQLIPILEKVSLEEPGSDFIEKWATLLASAALRPGDDVAICTSILGDMGPSEAAFLDDIQQRLKKCDVWSQEKISSRMQKWQIFADERYDSVSELFGDYIEGKVSEIELIKLLKQVSEASPNVIPYFQFGTGKGERTKYFLCRLAKVSGLRLTCLNIAISFRSKPIGSFSICKSVARSPIAAH